MVFTDISIFERLGRRNANIASTLALSILLLFFLFKLPFTPEIPKAGDEGGGVTVALGWPDAGSLNDTPSAGGGEPVPPVEQQASKSMPSASSASSAGELTSEDKEVDYAAELRKKEQVERKLKEIEDATRKRREEALAATLEQRRIQEEEAARQKAAEYAQKKAGLGGLFKQGSSGGSGKGSGNTGKAGNGGDPKGDPNSRNLEGGGDGGGKGGGVGALVGGGIGNRGVVNSAPPRTNYNENGDVVISVCVYANGQVNPSTVKVLTKGTTTTSEVLRNIAKENARTYRFREGSDEDCGTITYRFRVK